MEVGGESFEKGTTYHGDDLGLDDGREGHEFEVQSKIELSLVLANVPIL